MAYLERSQPAPSVARAKALPLGLHAEPAPSLPTTKRQTMKAAMAGFVRAWFAENNVSERDLAAMLDVNPKVARKKLAGTSDFSIADECELPDHYYDRFCADKREFRRSFLRNR